MFVTDTQCNEVAEQLFTSFEHGELHSQSSIKEVARVAQELLTDNGLPSRWSLACVISKKAQAAWRGTIDLTKEG